MRCTAMALHLPCVVASATDSFFLEKLLGEPEKKAINVRSLLMYCLYTYSDIAK